VERPDRLPFCSDMTAKKAANKTKRSSMSHGALPRRAREMATEAHERNKTIVNLTTKLEAAGRREAAAGGVHHGGGLMDQGAALCAVPFCLVSGGTEDMASTPRHEDHGTWRCARRTASNCKSVRSWPTSSRTSSSRCAGTWGPALGQLSRCPGCGQALEGRPPCAGQPQPHHPRVQQGRHARDGRGLSDVQQCKKCKNNIFRVSLAGHFSGAHAAKVAPSDPARGEDIPHEPHESP
jgi:hypothetical protein